MVAVADPENAIELVRNTYKLCSAKDAQVELLHMVPVPDQVPLADAGRLVLEGKESIIEAMLYLAHTFPTSTSLRYCRSISRGIVSALKERGADMLVTGWRGEEGAQSFGLGSTLDPVVRRSPCDVVILKDCGGNRSFRRVLVPVAGGPNAAFALEIAGILCHRNQGEILVFTAITDTKRFDVEKFVAVGRDRLGLPGERVRTKTVVAEDPAQAILNESKDHDLVVLGWTRKHPLQRLVRTAIPLAVAEACRKPLIIVKASDAFPLTPAWMKAHRRRGRA